MGLTKPFGFMGSGEGGAGAGFDPTVGGLYSVVHHWDFTDTSTMTFGASNGANNYGPAVATVTDKVGSIVMQPVNGPSGGAAKITTSGSLYTGSWGTATYMSGSPYQNYNGGTYNWLPDDMRVSGEFTVVAICGAEWTSLGSNLPRAMWYARSNADSDAYDNLLFFMLYQGSWQEINCSGSSAGGTKRAAGFGRYRGSWNPTPKSIDFNSNPDEISDPGVWSLSYASGSGDYEFQLNDTNACTHGTNTTRANASGEGLCIGGAPIGLNEKNCFEGNWFHYVVYNQALTQEQRNSVYDEWERAFSA